MQRRLPVISVTSVAVLVIVQLFLTSFNLPAQVSPYDEGITNYYAQRILFGELPYRDFWTLYAPGQYYWLSALFQIFGVSLLVSRISDMVFRVLLTTMLYLVASKIASPKTALVTWALVVVWIMPRGVFGYVAIPTLLLCTISVYSLIQYFHDTKSRYLVISGIFAGLSIVFRQDFIFYLLAAEICALVVFTYFQHNQYPFRQRLRHLAQHLALYGIGLLSIIGPCVLIVFFYFSPADLFDQLFVFTLTIHRSVRWRSFPTLDFNHLRDVVVEWIPSYLPLAIYVLTPGWATSRLFRQRDQLPNLVSILLIGLFSALLYAQVISRNDYSHRLPTFLMMMPLLAVFLSQTEKFTQRVAQVTLIIFLILTLYPASSYFRQVNRTLTTGCMSEFERSSCLSLTHGQDQAIAYILNHTTEDDYVFVGLPQHDRIVVYDNVFLFVAKRRSPTKYQEIHPGLADTLPIQKSIVQSLIEHDVQYVVLTTRFEDRPLEPNATAVGTGVVYLDDYIRANYQQIEQFDTYQIWERSTVDPIIPQDTS